MVWREILNAMSFNPSTSECLFTRDHGNVMRAKIHNALIIYLYLKIYKNLFNEKYKYIQFSNWIAWHVKFNYMLKIMYVL